MSIFDWYLLPFYVIAFVGSGVAWVGLVLYIDYLIKKYFKF